MYPHPNDAYVTEDIYIKQDTTGDGIKIAVTSHDGKVTARTSVSTDEAREIGRRMVRMANWIDGRSSWWTRLFDALARIGRRRG